MRIFLDTANISEIKEAASWGILNGVTTNPTLAAREGREYRSAVREICGIVDGPVSAEVVSVSKDEMIEEGLELATIADNIAVKVPINLEGLAATRALSKQGVAINMTLVFTVNQAMLAAAAGAAYVSCFLGRLDDISSDGVGCLADMIEALDNYDLKTQTIAASIRHPMHVAEVARMGVDIATVPFAVVKKMVHHPLTDKGIASFLADWDALQAKLKKTGSSTGKNN